MTASTPSEMLWVLLKSKNPGVVNQHVQVSTEDCTNIDDFKNAVTTKLELDQATYRISIRLNEDAPPAEPDAALSKSNTVQTALIVSVPLPATPTSRQFTNTGHQEFLFLKQSGVDVTCPRLLDTITIKLHSFYDFPVRNPRCVTIRDVLAAKGTADKPGRWSFRLHEFNVEQLRDDYSTINVHVGDRMTHVALPDVLTAAEWKELEDINMINNRVNGVDMSTRSDGRSSMRHARSGFNHSMVAFLQKLSGKVSSLYNHAYDGDEA